MALQLEPIRWLRYGTANQIATLLKIPVLLFQLLYLRSNLILVGLTPFEVTWPYVELGSSGKSEHLEAKGSRFNPGSSQMLSLSP